MSSSAEMNTISPAVAAMMKPIAASEIFWNSTLAKKKPTTNGNAIDDDTKKDFKRFFVQ